MPQDEEWIPGSFWLAGSSEGDAVHGRLYLSSELRLELEGAVTPAFEVKERRETESGEVVLEYGYVADGPEVELLTIFGRLRVGHNKKVSLFECYTVHRSGDLLSMETSLQILRPAFGVRGIHRHQSGGISGVRIEQSHLPEWTRAPGFTTRLREGGSAELVYDEPSRESAELENGAEVALHYETTYTTPSPTGGSISRRIYIEVAGFPASDYREVERLYLVPLGTLVTLCVFRQSEASHVCVSYDGTWVQILSGALLEQSSAKSEVKPWDILMTMDDFGVKGLASWLDNVERLGPLPPVVASSVGLRSIRLETVLAELTSVTEGLHSRRSGEAVALVDRPTFKRVRSLVVEALSGEPERLVELTKKCLEGLRRPSYRDRLRQLHDEVEEIAPEIFGNDFDKWSSVVTDCRNEFAHRDVAFMTPDSSGKYAAVVYSLRWLLVIILLLEAGVDREVIRDRLQQFQPYFQFQRQAPAMLPEVYGEASGAAAEE